MDKLNSLIARELSADGNISIINLLDTFLSFAFTLNASDIHIDPSPLGLRIRFRTDGVLSDVCFLPSKIHHEVISRIKILAGLRTDEHQSAQDGRFRFRIPDTEEDLDVRVSVMPTHHGENAVLRLLLDKSQGLIFENLGFREKDQAKILKAIKKSSGMILVTGPTGSGKTTTLYSLIKILNTKDISIVTLEDPIEYAVQDIEQIQVNQRTGINFANGLRSILRQDPDIIMVGEIRDSETASISINTALTGHLLLSTLHTNDAVTALPRMLDMRVEPFLVASTVNLVISQRLVRKLCEKCKYSKVLTKEEYTNIISVNSEISIKPNQKIFSSKGCDSCNLSGYKGRTVLGEVLEVDEEIRRLILNKDSSKELCKSAISRGMTTMFEDGIEKVKSGITTLEEVFRSVGD